MVMANNTLECWTQNMEKGQDSFTLKLKTGDMTYYLEDEKAITSLSTLQNTFLFHYNCPYALNCKGISKVIENILPDVRDLSLANKLMERSERAKEQRLKKKEDNSFLFYVVIGLQILTIIIPIVSQFMGGLTAVVPVV